MQQLPDPSSPQRVAQRARSALPRTTLPAPLGPFMLERRLGIGGMAEVFLAKKDGPAGFSKQIVVKRILPHLAEDQRFVDMFLREAQTAAGLNHTNVVQVYELGEHDGQYYIAMEYVDGVTLYKLARRAWHTGRSVPMEVVLRSIADAALGLHHAHTMRDPQTGQVNCLVHRDISPDNLMLNRDGVTKVLDFGIAKGANSRGVTKTGELKGKIPYMSPEQIQGLDLDGRSDLYSLGITMYWLLTGQRPFAGATELMTLQGVLTEQATPPSEINAHVPPAVDDIVMALLEKDRELRPGTGAELHDMLVSLAPGRTSESSSFVVEMIETEDKEAPASAPISGGFVPSTPLTTKLGSAERQVIKKLPAGVGNKHKLPMAAIAGGVGGALVVAALLLGLVLGGSSDDDKLPPPPSDPGVTVKPIAPPPVEDPPDEPPADGDDKADADADADADVDELDDAAGDGDADAPPGGLKADEPTPTPPPRTRRRRRRSVRPAPKPAPKVALMAISTVAPRNIVWRAGKETVGVGSGRVQVPEGTSALTAFDTKTGGKSRVAVSGGQVDYNSLGTGRLSLRIFPFATVKLGKKLLGTTPLSPVSLIEGTYRVQLEHEGKKVTKTVTISKGGVKRLKVDMRKE